MRPSVADRPRVSIAVFALRLPFNLRHLGRHMIDFASGMSLPFAGSGGRIDTFMDRPPRGEVFSKKGLKLAVS